MEPPVYFGKCFDLKEIKAIVAKNCVKSRCFNAIQKKMKNPIMYNIFTRLIRSSPCVPVGASTREVYISFMETFLNSNPSAANHSYENGFEYLDSFTSRNFYLLESFFQVKIFVYEVRSAKQHGSRYKKLVKAHRHKNTIYKINFPSNICRRQSCFYIGSEYESQCSLYSWPALSVVLTSKIGPGKNKGYILNSLPDDNQSRFIEKTEPLSGLSRDVLVFRSKFKLSKPEAASVGLKINSETICLSGLITKNNKEVEKLMTSLIIVSPIKAAPALASISSANINQIYRVVQSYNKNGGVILVFRELPNGAFNIFQPSYDKIKECYEIGAKNSLEGIKAYKFLKTSRKQKSPAPSPDRCLCENYTTEKQEANISNKTYYNFFNCFQKPLKFHPKSLPIHCQLFDLFSIKDFRTRVEISSKCSLAFFDIESLTVPIPKQSSSLTPGLYLKNIDLQNMAIGYQKPFLIGYLDMLSVRLLQSSNEAMMADPPSNNLDVGFEEILHLAGNEINSGCIEPTFENACGLVERFILLLLERAKQMMLFKRRILSPITEYLESLKKIEDLHIEALEPEENVDNKPPLYSSNNKTEIEKALYALNSFIEELVIWGFNSSKFDAVILMPYLKYLLNTDKESPFYYRNYNLFRKGRVISNLAIRFKGTRVVFRDFLSIENPFTSLENMSRKYNVQHPKQVFPYGVLTSIKKLKSMTTMPLGDKYWTAMSGNLVGNEKRQRAASYFKTTGALNMYEYIIHYLKIDVLSLCECFFGYQKVLYETEDWNIIANKLYTISSLMYEKNYKQQFSNIWTNVAVFEIKNNFIKELLESSIMGGITTAMFRGLIGQHPATKKPTGLINSHLTYKDVKNIRQRWAGFYNLKKDYEARPESSQAQHQKLIEEPKPARYIHSYDFMSLYASAMYNPLPVGPARLWTYGYKNEENNFVKNCPASSTYNPHIHSAFFRNTVLSDKEEGAFIFHFLSKFDRAKYEFVMIRSGLHVGDQACFEYKAQPDLFITAREKKTQILTYFIINYDGAYFHGAHDQGCPLRKYNTKESIERKMLSVAKHKRRALFFDKFLKFRPHSEPVNVFYEVYTSCDMGYCTQAPSHKVLLNKEIFFPIKQKQISTWDLKDLILQRQIQGYIVIKGLKILEIDRVPAMGFCVQKTTVNIDWLSPATMELFEETCQEMKIDKDKYLKNMSKQKKILCLHEFKAPSVLHTEYFIYLYENHLLNSSFQILHCLEFVHSPFLKNKVKYYIERRFELKKKIKELEKTPTNTEDLAYFNALSDILKLYNNSLYGFSLLKGANYKSYKFIISHRLRFINKQNIVRARLIKQVSSKTFIVGIERRNTLTTTQAHIGSAIMFFSKLLFFRAVQFVLEHSDPRLLELTYCDTDSLHFAAHYSELELNMLESLRENFLQNKHRYFRTSNTQVSGVMDLEQISTSTVYICEKMYQKLLNSNYTTACKGVNRHLKLEFLEKPTQENPFQDKNIKTFKLRTLQIHSDIEDNIINKTITKIFGLGLIPTKRFFAYDGHSKTFN